MSDLFICKRIAGGYRAIEGTQYYIYEEIEPYAPICKESLKVAIDALEKANSMLCGYGANDTRFIRDAVKRLYDLCS